MSASTLCRLLSVTAVTAILGLTGCASQPSQTELAGAPPPAWAKTQYKVGARLFPRCMKIVATGSRINSSTYCMTDAEIAGLDDVQRSTKVDLMQRSGIDLGKGSN